jgi:hypothetical protein
MNARQWIRWILIAALLGLVGISGVAKAQEIKSLDFVMRKGDAVFVVTNRQSTLLDHDLILTPELKVMTNGIIKVSPGEEKKLLEGCKLTLDGFWLNDDGMLAQFKPHYILKDRGLFLVEDGIYRKANEEIAFKNGALLRTDGTVVTPGGGMIRLQDGQGLTAEGQTLHALDHIMMNNGKLVLQKDGSIVDLPSGRTIGMSDGTKVTGDGLVTKRSGEQIQLREGQRLTVDGAAMPEIH